MSPRINDLQPVPGQSRPGESGNSSKSHEPKENTKSGASTRAHGMKYDRYDVREGDNEVKLGRNNGQVRWTPNELKEIFKFTSTSPLPS